MPGGDGQDVGELAWQGKAQLKESDSCWRGEPGEQGASFRILANLLRNALSHTPPGGTVRVDVRGEGRDVTLTVSDTGVGIAPEHLERVFERVFRADAARTRGEGSGVGLTISRGLARAMGGDLEVRSAPGRGSTFRWMLRRDGVAGSPVRPTPRAEVQPPGR